MGEPCMNGISKLLSRLREEGKLVGTISAAKKRHADRQRIDRTPAKVRRKPKTEIPLSYDITGVASVRAHSEMPRIRNWLRPEPTTRRGGIFCTREQEGTYAGRKKYPFFANRIAVTSYGYAFGSRLYAQINDKTYKHEAPHGYVFGTDGLGIYITAKRESRRAHRLHLHTRHIQNYSKAFIRNCWIGHHDHRLVVEQEARLQRRRQRKLKALIKSQDFYVTAEDSRSAGNCMAGTLTWGKKHGLSLSAGVKFPAKVISRLINTHPSVHCVLEAAALRTLNERRYA